MPLFTKEQFISKAREKHGDRYSYDETVYLGSLNNVSVRCATHGMFTQKASSHLQGQGCSKCDRERRAAAATKTTEQYIAEVKLVHGDKYDYSKTNYTHSLQPVTITCPIHGDFSQIASIHRNGCGCRGCNLIGSKTQSNARRARLTQSEFIERSKQIHGNTYDYSQAKYVKGSTKVTLVCSVHGCFEISPVSHIHGKAGCKLCGHAASADKRKHDKSTFIKKAREAHGDKYSYDKVIYANIDTKVDIICRHHGIFAQTPYCHFKGQGCPSCTGHPPYTTAEYIEKATKIHKCKYRYDRAVYVSAHDLILVTCQLHGDFQTKAYSHLQGKGCRRCAQSANSSKIQIQWLEWQAVKTGAAIQHSDNIGEHVIRNSRYSADGYDPVSHTVFELNGDYFHGNPRKYPADEYNKLCKMTYGELYQNTLKKRQHILDQGYKLVEIWEMDFIADIKKIKVIQKAWRRYKSNKNIKTLCNKT